MGEHHQATFPNEPAAYRDARDALLTAEIELRAKAEEVAAMRRALPAGGAVAENYVLTEGPADLSADGDLRETAFADLFADGKDTLVVYSFMYPPNGNACPACTSLIDGLDGMSPHLNDKLNFVVFAKCPIETLRAWARERGWRNVRLLSSGDTSYNTDYKAEAPDGSQLPMINVFRKTGDGIVHTWGSELFFAPSPEGMHPRHADSIWPLWPVFDLTPDGRGDGWFPKFSYD